MTDNEIIKALECCGRVANVCDDCPIISELKDDCKCCQYLATNALDLINRQKAGINARNKLLARAKSKIEAMQMDNQQLQSDIANANMNLEHLQAEIERLKAESEKHSDECLKCYAKGLYEGITGFAERLKESFSANMNTGSESFPVPIIREVIDNILKEMGVEG